LDTFVFSYRLFLQKLRIFYPNSEIILLTGPMMQGSSLNVLQELLDRVLAYRAASGDTRVHRLDLSTQGELGYGCDWHPNVAQQRQNATELTAFVQQLMSW
ncbi:MAG: lipase, partial [Bacteroidota bacterium]